MGLISMMVCKIATGKCLSFSENFFSSPTSQKSAVGKYETSKCVSNQASKQTQKVVLKDPLIQGSYLKVCENPMYDPDSDILRCKIGAKVLQLPNPYHCRERHQHKPFLRTAVLINFVVKFQI